MSLNLGSLFRASFEQEFNLFQHLGKNCQRTSIIPPVTGGSKQYVELLYRNPKLYKLIWAPLESRLDGVKRVYYSPSGLLHLISLPAVAEKTEGLSLADQYDLHCMSSTRELVAEKAKLNDTNIQYALAYGGISYETDSIKMAEFMLKPGIEEEPSPLDKIMEDTILRGKIMEQKDSSNISEAPMELSYRFEEMKKVESSFKAKGIFTMSLSGYEALEESFKRLGRAFPSPDIIHVSTHGYFSSDPDPGEEKAGIPSSFSSTPLFRSKLLFAGCLDALNNKQPPRGFEDGILYAHEVANLNLSNTKLAVLSACKTGLGDIRGWEGVYGMQRAFKLAGAQYIVVSLWEIPDDVTVEFMDMFYRLWLSGEAPDMRDAFVEAQREIKKKGEEHKNYYSPFYWAGFVLF